ncbi:MAG: hypothetical protein SPE99_06850 [Blautia sp.]|nr:hypothetical protein [Blautia sp.]
MDKKINNQDDKMDKMFAEIESIRNEWTELVSENNKLRTEYNRLIAEIREYRDINKKATVGSTLRYRLARWLLK